MIQVYMWWQINPPREFQRHLIRYLYARTSMALENADDAIDAFAAFCPRPVANLKLTKHFYTWSNGFVLQLENRNTPSELAEQLHDGLEPMDAWAILDHSGAHAESVNIGPVSSCLEGYSDFAQLFLLFDERDQNHDGKTRAIIEALEAANMVAKPVFHFSDGRAIIVLTSDPCTMIRRRCETQISSVFRWMIVDSHGDFLLHPDAHERDGWRRFHPQDGGM